MLDIEFSFNPTKKYTETIIGDLEVFRRLSMYTMEEK